MPKVNPKKQEALERAREVLRQMLHPGISQEDKEVAIMTATEEAKKIYDRWDRKDTLRIAGGLMKAIKSKEREQVESVGKEQREHAEASSGKLENEHVQQAPPPPAGSSADLHKDLQNPADQQSARITPLPVVPVEGRRGEGGTPLLAGEGLNREEVFKILKTEPYKVRLVTYVSPKVLMCYEFARSVGYQKSIGSFIEDIVLSWFQDRGYIPSMVKMSIGEVGYEREGSGNRARPIVP